MGFGISEASGRLSYIFGVVEPGTNYFSLVEMRCRLRMYSRTADMAYRTARPTLMKRGPVPFRRDLANHDGETARSLATCAGCSRGSSSLVLAGAPMAPLLFLSPRGMHHARAASAKKASSYPQFHRSQGASSRAAPPPLQRARNAGAQRG